MSELAIRFQSDHEADPDGRITFTLSWLKAGTYTDPLPFTPPLDAAALREIHWYLEEFSQWPSGPDYERASRIESRLPQWGHALLKSLTADHSAARIWQQFSDDADDAADGVNKTITLDATDPRVLRLPWELIADESGHLFANGLGLRRRMTKTAQSKTRPVALPVRILVVVARPDDAGFIDPRADAIALLDATASLGEQVAVEFLYPPTLAALTNRLRSRAAPPVHVVHFDGHGVYEARQGLGYLFFEKENHQSDQVDANRLGTLLQQARVPLMVLSACQSAMQQQTNPYASVAARLIRAGVGSVLAMNYSVLVVAAHKFVSAFYAALAAGLTVGGAVDEGRFALLQDVDRHTLTRHDKAGNLVEETIRLHDWFLPALYQQSDDPALFAANPHAPAAAPPLIMPTRQTYPQLVNLLQTRFGKEELRQLCYELGLSYDDLPGDGNAAKALSLLELVERQNALPILIEAARRHRPLAAWDAALTPSAAATALAPSPPRAALRAPQLNVPAALPAAPQYGFVGRAREMLALQRAFAAAPIVVLHGFGGLGKTALAAEAGRWFTRTGRFPGGAAFISVEHGGSLAQLCSWVGQRVSGDADWVIHGDGELTDRVGRLLAEKPALLILDNFESLLGREPLMPAEELAALLDALYRWVGQSERLPYSALLITTRDTSFPDARFAPGQRCRHIQLGGLATADALGLAAAILDAHGIDRAAIPRQELVELMAHLGGHPLSLNLALPHLKEYTPAQLMAQFEELLPGFVAGKAEARNESLAVSLEFSLRRLGEATRQALPDLAVFESIVMETDLLQITGIDGDLWRMARSELEQAALVTLETVPGVNPPFLRFHPTLLPYLSTHLDKERRAELETKYWQFYYGLANYLVQADTQTPHQARAIALRELPNLRRGVALALAAGAVEPAVDFADSVAKFLDYFGRWREREALLAMVNDAAEIRNPKSAITQAEFMLLDRQGDTLLQQGRAQQAEELFRELLARLEAGAAYEAAYDIAMTQMRMGRCLAAQGRPSQAIAWQEKAIAGFARLSDTDKSAKEMLGRVYTDLADNLASTGQFDAAQEAYENGLEVSREVGDDRSVGVKLGQLGTLAMRRGDLAAAQKRHREALDTFRALGEPQMEAVAWHQLGVVAEEAKQWAEAERCYRESLQIEEAHQNWPGVAQTCNQLAIVAQGDGRPADAERWYLRAIELGRDLKYYAELRGWLSNLASLYLSQNQLDKATEYAEEAVEVQEKHELSTEAWKLYSILAQIAAAQGRAAASAQWRRQEQESYAAYAGAAHQLPSWAPGFIQAVALAAQGNQEAGTAVAQLLPQLEKGGWMNLTASIKRILAGEQDHDALYANLDREDAYIIRAILQQLSGGAPPPAAPQAEAETEEGVSLNDFLNSLLNGVAAAAQPDAPAALRAQLTAVTQALAADPSMPADLQALGAALHAILNGERRPDLSALPAPLAAAVAQVLAQIS